jgi:hypothetical protein
VNWGGGGGRQHFRHREHQLHTLRREKVRRVEGTVTVPEVA